MKAEKNEQGAQSYAKMEALKLVIKLDPIQLGVLYTPDGNRRKKRLYLVDLQNLLMLGDARRITEAIYAQHGAIFRRDKIPFEQVSNLLQKMMEFIQNEIMDDDELMDSAELSPSRQRQVT